MVQLNWYVQVFFFFATSLYALFPFQSSIRGADLMLVRSIYRQGIAMHNDFLGTVGAYNFQFLSARPKQIQNYLMLFWPFDRYIWAFLFVSVVAVTITLVMIDTIYANWTNASTKDIVYQSRYDTSNLDI